MKLKLGPAPRWIPEGAVKVSSKKCEAVAYLYKSPVSGAPCAVAYIGKSSKAAFQYRYGSEKIRAERVASWFASVEGSAASKAARLAERKAKMSVATGLKVGDVLSGQWGYDQTNLEFWQVTKILGKRKVEIRELACESVETGFMSGNAVPLPGQFTKREPLVRIANQWDSVKLFDWGCYLSKVEPIKVDGKPVGYGAKMWTAYA